MERETKMCRACLDMSTNLLINWHRKAHMDKSYADCFCITQLAPNVNKHLEYLCYQCAAELKAAYIFIEKAKVADRILKGETELLKHPSLEWMTVDQEELLDEEKQLDSMKVDVFIEENLSKGTPQTKNFPDVDIPKEQLTQPLNMQSSEETLPTKLVSRNTHNEAKRPKQSESGTKTKARHYSRPLLCDACPRSFQSATQLLRHQDQAHNENRQRNIACEHCPRRFYEMKVYLLHLKTHDKTRKREFACDECGKQFHHKATLQMHKRWHAGDVISCLQCDARFLRQTEYRIHLQIHAGEQPYECPYCKRRFARTHVMSKHVRHVHEGERYECETCGKLYKDKASMQEHQKEHTNMTRYKCDLCETGFVIRARLRRHIRKKHKIIDRTAIDSHILLNTGS